MESRLAVILLIVLVVLLTTGALAGAFIWYCIHMPGPAMRGGLPPLSEQQQQLRDRLTRHVYVLAEEIGERNSENMPALQNAADYIAEQFRSFGYVPVIREFGGKRYRNISVELRGREKQDEVIVIGAHYDTVWLTPGADDNASGIAGLLEIARALAGRRFAKTLRFIAFCNEEEPFYGTDEMGSQLSAERSRNRGENIIAMFSLEMIGYYSDEPGSQRYPEAIRHFYPDRANFIAFVANLASRKMLHQAIARFREQAAFPSEGMVAPEWLVPDIRRSDNASYWKFNYPATMITDTSNYRNHRYHNVGDVPESLDYTSMARVVTGLIGMTAGMAGN
jgi:uncharacterized membrane protein